jgi:hypothetical protein
MATVTRTPTIKIPGGSFLITESMPDDVFTPEDFSEQHWLIAQTAEKFASQEIVPNLERMEHKDFACTRELVRKAGRLEMDMQSAERVGEIPGSRLVGDDSGAADAALETCAKVCQPWLESPRWSSD